MREASGHGRYAARDLAGQGRGWDGAGMMCGMKSRRASRVWGCVTGGLTLLVLLWGGMRRARAADWPTYRGDAGRTAHSPDSLDLPLNPVWSYQDTHEPRPAWPTSQRMQFDEVMQVVARGDRVVMGSSVDGSVFALDANSGRIAWRFFTEGPIRFAPVLWRDRVFVASDDGDLYSLRLADGSLQWKHRGHPSEACVLGNRRMISKWPMRGGPVVADGIVYCAAGIWPSDGIRLYALDAKTGAVVWENTDSGAIYMPQPHGGANANSGISAQGYLLVSGDELFVPTGRAVPACLDRHTGKLKYFHLQRYGKNGESLAMAINNVLFNDRVGYDVRSGLRVSKPGAGRVAAIPGGVAGVSDGKVAGYRWEETTKPNRKGKPETVRSLTPTWKAEGVAECEAIVTAGHQVILGGPDSVHVVDSESEEMVWQAAVDGVVGGLAVANGRLFVSTDQGTVHCFAAEATGSAGDAADDGPSRPAPPAASWSSDLSKTAQRILRQTRVTEGYCLDLGCGDGALARELARHSELQVIAVDPDPENVRVARENLFAEGLLGNRITVLRRTLDQTGLPSYFADLVVSRQSLQDEMSDRVYAEASRLQRPGGGKLCWGRDGEVAVSTREALKGSGTWTHQYADPANTVNSGDERVEGRLSVLWYRNVDFAIPSRHGRAPAPLFKSGRLFHEGLHGLIAVDAYNGRELWRYEQLPNVLKPYDGDELMGVAGTGSNFCVGGENVYVRHEDRCLRLDAATGALIDEFPAPKRDGEADEQQRPTWGYIAWDDGLLFGSTANPNHVVTYRYRDRGGDMSKQLTESTSLFALDAETGDQMWRYQASESIRHNAIAIADGTVFLIDRPMALFDRDKKPKSKEHPPGKLVALDARTGEKLWENQKDIHGTMLAASSKHQVILMSYQPTRFRLDSERGGWMAGFHAESGEQLWDIKADYASRPMLNDRTIYVQGGAWDLLTGKSVPFEFERSYGCGILASSRKMLLFRSATLGYYDLSGARETVNYGGIRPGCWINAIPVGGLVLMPDATAGCECSYLNKAWIALEPAR
ncbi:MAG: PQQ-binding-like beta-propeller repeat protein [Planctomycetota bacterium]